MWFLAILLIILPLGFFKGSWFLAQLTVLSWIFPHAYGWMLVLLSLPIMAFARGEDSTPPLWVRVYRVFFLVVDKYLFLLWPALPAACTRAHSHEVWPWLAWPLALVIAQTPVGIMMARETDRAAATRGIWLSFAGFLAFALFPGLGRAMYGWSDPFLL